MPKVEPLPIDPREPARADIHGEPHLLPGERARETSPIVEYLHVLRVYKWSIFSLSLIAALVGVLMAASAVPVYRAQARILVKFNQPTIAGVQQFEGTPMHWVFYETQSDIIRSRAIAERVVDRLGLGSAADAAAEGQSAPVWRALLDRQVPDWQDWIPPEWRPDDTDPVPVNPRTAAVDRLLGSIAVSGGKESEVLVVSADSVDPQRAALIVNAVSETYADFRLESRLSIANQATSWLGQRLEGLRLALEKSERALSEFQREQGMVDTRSRESIISARLGTLTAELIRAQTRSTEAGERYTQLRGLDGLESDASTMASLVDNVRVREASQTLTALRRKVSELTERYGEKHPKMISARADLANTEHRLEDEVGKAVQKARREFEVASAQEGKLKQLIESQQREMRALSGKAFELAKREREVEANRQLYESFLSRFKEADVAEEYDVSSVRIIDRAEVPTVPFKPNKSRIVGMYALMGVFIGVGLAVVRFRIDRTFKGREDVEHYLDLPVLGLLPKVSVARGTRPERQVFEANRSVLSEAVNGVRTALMFARSEEPPAAILVTSAVADEGKTTLASNLALSMSKRGRTLLVDGDLRKGRIASLTPGTERAPGLTELITGEASVTEAVFPDPDSSELFTIGTGKRPPNPLDVLSSARFSKCLADLGERFDYIIIDGSPLLPVSDSVVLGHLVDGVVLAIRTNDTSIEAAREATKRLTSAGVNILGVVLQQVNLRKMRAYSYRYSSYRGDSYGYAQPDSEA